MHSPKTLEPAFLFVYGTLRSTPQGRLHPLLQTDAEFIGTASMPGHLYNIGDYPGAISPVGCRQRIHGEIYRLYNANDILAVLDDYEECTARHPRPHEYRRREMPVRMENNGQLKAWVYLYNRSTVSLEIISSGEYRHPGLGQFS